MLKMKTATIIIAALVTLGLLVAVASAQSATPTPTANLNSAVPGHFSDLISSAQASGKSLTFDFIVPLVTGERVWTLPDDSIQRSVSAIGADYVCFSEPWNSGSRERCTPFNNISSVTFLK